MRKHLACLLTVLAALAAVIGTVTPRAEAAAVTPGAQTAAAARRAQAADQWNPPSHLVQPLNEVWHHVESTYGNLYGFRNYGWDQVMANTGYVNYCVRWESDAPVSAALRDRIHASLKKQFGKWMSAMVDNGTGHNAWPYTNVQVNVVGWAVENRSTLQWTDNSVDIYTGVLDGGGAPQCAPDCGRFFHQDGNYSRCPGGVTRHYDQSLWLTKGFQGGAGGDWGQAHGPGVLHGRPRPGEHPHLPARGRSHLRPGRLLRLVAHRPVLLPDEGGQRDGRHRVRQVDAARLLAPPETALRAVRTLPRALPGARGTGWDMGRASVGLGSGLGSGLGVRGGPRQGECQIIEFIQASGIGGAGRPTVRVARYG
ncbi:hypothetical protein GCM10010145_54680 [Streptomyces ruber]|uniref:Secreted protein n=2 Tax=Streptomyces TaxID=1883 RepID=A0A918BM05_9ACTN|nr:hypothetical protein GCM10010145_54680 [Streptomyces ruber]